MPLKGYKQTAEHKLKNSSSKIGIKHPNRKKYFRGKSIHNKICSFCNIDYVANNKNHKRSKYCSMSCRARDNINISLLNLRNVDRDYQNKVASSIQGTKHPRWIADRTLLKDDHKDRGGQLHRYWSLSVKKRDNWKCKLKSSDCFGRLESHHLYSWKEYTLLRYEVSNGVCLCKCHHPRTKNSEKDFLDKHQELLKTL